MKKREDLVYEVEVVVGRDRIRLRCHVLDTLILLERELTQADGSTFTHSVWVDDGKTLFDYMTADPYFMQLERHYNVIQEKASQVLGQRK